MDRHRHPDQDPAGGITDVVIDTDPGIDDVVTLALAALSPTLRLAAVTTTYGNAPLASTTRNAREVLRLAGRSDIAVMPGSDRPLVKELVTAPETHGESGVGHAPVPPANPLEPPNDNVLAGVLRQLPEPVTLITLGPLTNLAHAIEHDVAMVLHQVRRHVGMFGSIHERGDTHRWADFNAWCDPEATDIVLQAGLDTLMVGLDVTRRVVIDAVEVKQLTESPDPLVHWLGLALQFYVEFHVRHRRQQGCVVNDVLTIGELLAPGLLEVYDMDITVDLDEGPNRGHTRERSGGSATKVALNLDLPIMRQLLSRLFGNRLGDDYVR